MTDIFKMNVIPEIIYKTSKVVFESYEPKINYHLQSDDKYYPNVLPSKLEIKEFILEEKREEVLKLILEKIKTMGLKYYLNTDEVKAKGEGVSEEVQKSTKNSFIESFLKYFPTKAFVVKTDYTLNVLTYYDKVKEEINQLKSDKDLTNIGPGNILYYALTTAYSVEKNVRYWENSIKSPFFGDIKIDLFGKSGFKKFEPNAAYIPTPYNILSLGTFFSSRYEKVVNASQDSDVVNHEIGHAILDRIRSNYIDSKYHLEGAAIHEAFSDINAFLMAAMDENIQIPNNLDNPNVLSSISEYFGKAIYTELEIEKKILNENPFIDIKQIEVDRPIRDLSKKVEYLPYTSLPVNKKEEHSYSLALSTTFYRAFASYAKEIGDIKKAAQEFFKIFTYGTVISPVAPTNMQDFYKSFIIADILYNDSKLSSYLLKSAKESNLLNDSIEKIKEEIEQSRKLELPKFREFLLAGKYEPENKLDKNLMEKLILEDLRKIFPEFNHIKELKIDIVPGIEGINIEGIYTYPTKVDGKIDVYGGILLVFDKNFQLIYSKVELPSFEKVSVVNDYYNLQNPGSS